MKNSGVTVRNFVSEALLRAFNERELEFSAAIGLNEYDIINELIAKIGIDFTVYVEGEFSEASIKDLESSDLETAFYDSNSFQQSLLEWLENAFYDAKQAAKEAFRNYLFTKVDTQDLANELVSYVERNN